MIGLVTEFDIKADVLVSLALIASVCIREDFAAGEVAFIMQLGGMLEELTVAKARAGIEKLVHLTPQTARIIGHQDQRNAEEKLVAAEQVVVGDILRVLPRGYDSGCILSMCSGACDTDSNYGGDWKCNKAWISGQGSTCAVSAGRQMHNAGSVLVIINSALLLNWKKE